ncbi:MAG: DUF512 domain-containing protein [Actinomycetota bacterium]
MRTNELIPTVTSVEESSFGERIGLRVGDRIVSINTTVPRDILEWYRLSDGQALKIEVDRDGEILNLDAERQTAEALGVSVSSAVFDRVQTCDNHCEFCFIYQLPKGMRRSLYLKDDDYRLSFLFGNFTTLTRFTEADLERVIDENLSPLFVSVHATDPHTRAEMLRNERGGVSLRWLRQLLDAGIEVRAQIVMCPGVNDGEVLADTLSSLLEDFPELSSVAVVPVGLSKHNTETRMRVHTPAESEALLHAVESWQQTFLKTIGRRFVFAADEFYLNAGISCPDLSSYEDLHMIEDGIGITSRFVHEFETGVGTNDSSNGFFQAMDNPSAYIAAANPAGDTGLRPVAVTVGVKDRPSKHIDSPMTNEAPQILCVLTGGMSAPLLTGLIKPLSHDKVVVVGVENQHFGGNTAVAGLLTGTDIRSTCEQLVARLGISERTIHFLLPDVCLNSGVFLDGIHVEDLQKEFLIDVIPARGHVLKQAVMRFVEKAGARNV